MIESAATRGWLRTRRCVVTTSASEPGWAFASAGRTAPGDDDGDEDGAGDGAPGEDGTGAAGGEDDADAGVGGADASQAEPVIASAARRTRSRRETAGRCWAGVGIA
jgi:hypothetical protein